MTYMHFSFDIYIFAPSNLVAEVELMTYIVDLYTYLFVSKLFFI